MNTAEAFVGQNFGADCIVVAQFDTGQFVVEEGGSNEAVAEEFQIGKIEDFVAILANYSLKEALIWIHGLIFVFALDIIQFEENFAAMVVDIACVQNKPAVLELEVKHHMLA